MIQDLQIIYWPDPRLLRKSDPVRSFGPELEELAAGMLRLMKESKGVGLAAPQVGVNLRLFVMNSGREGDEDRVYVNPVLSSPSGDQEGEEGCLSLPKIYINVLRADHMVLEAQDLRGNPIREEQSGYVSRIWQHEVDHLNGITLVDRMGPVSRMAHRKQLRQLRADFESAQKPNRRPSSLSKPRGGT